MSKGLDWARDKVEPVMCSVRHSELEMTMAGHKENYSTWNDAYRHYIDYQCPDCERVIQYSVKEWNREIDMKEIEKSKYL